MAAGEWRVYVMTVGPGELPYERYGHNALIFEFEEPPSIAFDWGRFNFEQPGFLWRFVRGDMWYGSGLSDAEAMLRFYGDVHHRRVLLQELNLTQSQAQELLRLCQVSYLPENREYPYDYFGHPPGASGTTVGNCSTKLRDLLDEALGGQIREQLAGVSAGTTYRIEAERHMAPDWPLWFGIHAGLGRPAEKSLDAWEQSFVPMELARWLSKVEIAGETGAVPLVRGETLASSGRPDLAAPERAPRRWLHMGLLGVGLAGLMILPRHLRARWPSRLVASGWYLFAGLAGLLGTAVWAFTAHWAGYQNQSILLLSPLALPLAAMLFVPRWATATRLLAAVHLALCLVAVLLHVIPGVGQANLAAIVFALPANAAGAWVAGLRPRRAPVEPCTVPAT